MNTTELFVEIIVIGVGVDLWLGLLILTFFGYSWIPWGQFTSIVSLVPFLAVTYVLGITIDRLADQIYSRWDKKLRSYKFTNNAEYHQARTATYTHASDNIIDLFEYGRSRLRISRSWSINFALIGTFISTFIWFNFPSLAAGLRIRVMITSIFIFGSLCILNVLAWRKLAINDYKRLAEMRDFIKSI
jgi:hypothetical protein